MLPLVASSSKSTTTATATFLASRFPLVKSFVSLSFLWLLFLSKQLWISTDVTSMSNSQYNQKNNNNHPNDQIKPLGEDPTSSIEMSYELGPLPARDDPHRLIFLISMGQEAMQSKLVERFVWSARHRGEWDGWIVLLTDAPIDRYQHLFPKHNNNNNNKINNNNNPKINNDDPHWIVMNPLAQHFNTSFREDMPYKRFKTYILEYIDMDSRLDDVKLIYYLDVDIIVGNSLPKLFQELEGIYAIPQPYHDDGDNDNTKSSHVVRQEQSIPKIWFFQNKYKHLTVQGGQFILDRSTSRPCLTFWRELIDSNVTEAKDQPALQQMKLHQQERLDAILNPTKQQQLQQLFQSPPPLPRCQIVTMEWKRYIHFPSNSTVFTAVEKINKKKQPAIPTLIHFKNSCNTTSQINNDVEETYINYVLKNNKELAQKIHVQPDNNNNNNINHNNAMISSTRMKHVVDDQGRIHLA